MLPHLVIGNSRTTDCMLVVCSGTCGTSSDYPWISAVRKKSEA